MTTTALLYDNNENNIVPSLRNSYSNNDNRLHSLVASGQLDRVQRLIASGYDPNTSHSITGLKPIHFAASRGHVDLVHYLVQSCQVQIDAVDREGETALLKAAYAGHLLVVQYLVQSNANHLHQDRDGWTALHNACSFGNLDLVKYLLSLHNVNVNVISNQGHTPLMNAASKGHVDIVKYLLNEEINAKPLVKNKFGETAYDVAAAAGEAYLCQVIEQFEFKWYHPLPFNSLNMHVTIPVLLIEEQQIIIIPIASSLASSYNIGSYLLSKSPNHKTATTYSDSIWYFKGDTVLNKSKVDLPNTSWFWLSDWTLELSFPTVKSDEGWTYSQNSINMEDENNWFAQLPPDANNSQNWIRRRQWMRIMKKVIHPHITSTISNHSNDANSIHSDSSDSSSSDDDNDLVDLHQHNRQNFKKKTMTSVSTTMTKAQSIFIGCSTHTQPLLQEQISIVLPTSSTSSASSNSSSSDRSSPQEEQDNPILLQWESNDKVLDCRRCHRWFNFIVRRHHCRKCGQIICDRCSTQRVYLPPSDIIQPVSVPIQSLHMMSMQPQRICDQCLDDVNNSDLIIRSKNRRSSAMLECPVCTKKLTEYATVQEGEDHVQACLSGGQSSSAVGIRFVVYKLTSNSILIGQECVICFEEFELDDTVTRLNCMCSYHSHCINNWFSKGKECPVHSQ